MNSIGRIQVRTTAPLPDASDPLRGIAGVCVLAKENTNGTYWSCLNASSLAVVNPSTPPIRRWSRRSEVVQTPSPETPTDANLRPSSPFAVLHSLQSARILSCLTFGGHSNKLATQEECQKQNGITPRSRMASEHRPVSLPDSTRLGGEPRPTEYLAQGLPSADCTGKIGIRLLDDQELEIGLKCIGSVVLDQSGGVVGALSITGSAMRLTWK
jgi:hypothetical protein